MKRLFFIIFVFIVLFSLTGCWSSKELNDSAILAGMAVEKEGKEYKITYQIVKPAKVKERDPKSYIMISSTGPTVSEANRRLIKGIKKSVTLSQTRVIIISPEIAKENIYQVLDLGYRNQKFRLTSYLYVTKNPAEVLSKASPLDPVSSFGLSIGVNAVKHEVSEMSAVNLEEFMEQSMATQGCGCSYVNLLRLHQEDEPAESHVDVIGLGIIMNGKLVKEIYSIEEQRGLLWFQNKIKGGVISVHLDKEHMATINILDAKTSIKPRLENNKLIIDVKVKTKGDIEEITSYKNLNNKVFEELEEDFARHIKSEMESILKTMREEPVTEALGIGLEVHRQYPDYWNNIKNDWGSIFKNTDINIDVNVEIKNLGLIKNLNRPEPEKKISIFPWKN